MLDKIIYLKFKYFLDLIRFYKPIGFMLLMWPCFFAMTLLPLEFEKLIKWYGFFFIGAFLMRSAGCIINDLIDIKIDKKIERTKKRPLASKKLSITEALIFLSILLFLSFLILLQFNYFTILAGMLSMPIVILYPLMKRFTNWPQLILGFAFSWGIIIVNVEFLKEFNLDFFLLFIGCTFWTLAYDTIYAYQDRFDDIKNNIKSSAVLLGNKGRIYLIFFYLIFFLIIGYLSVKSSGNYYNLIVIIIAIFVMNNLLNKWDPKSKNNSDYYFNFNNIIGLGCFLFLLIF